MELKEQLLADPKAALVVFVLAYLVLDKLSQWRVIYWLKLGMEFLVVPVRTMNVDMTPAEAKDELSTEPSKSTRIDTKRGQIQCFDPSTNQPLGQIVAMKSADVYQVVEKARKAQKEWQKTSFSERRQVLRTIQAYICSHIEDICRVSTRDSGKPKVDALLGEVLTSCEKIRTINAWGELWLEPDYRPTGPLMMHKNAWVEYVPLGVIGTIGKFADFLVVKIHQCLSI